jgi:GT2 family glycosyltransferase
MEEAGTLPVSAIVLAYERPRALETVLDRLATSPVEEVLVVENGSGASQAVATGRNRVRVLEPGENVGQAAGRNIAARVARGEFLLMLDDDSYPCPGAVRAMVAVLRRSPRLAALGGLVCDRDDEGKPLDEARVGSFDWFLRAARDGPSPIDGWAAFFFPAGACMLRRSAYLQAGGYFEPYFPGALEIDLATRLLALGWDVRYLPTARFEHLRDQSGPIARLLFRRYRIRNQIWYFWLHFPTSLAIRRIPAYLAFDLIESFYRDGGRSWVTGVREAWSLRGSVRGARHPLQRSVLKRAELNRGRMHVRLLTEMARSRLSRVAPVRS